MSFGGNNRAQVFLDVIVDLDATLEDLYMGGTLKVCEQCPNVKYEREGEFIYVDIEKGMQDGQEVVFYEDGEPKINGVEFEFEAPHDAYSSSLVQEKDQKLIGPASAYAFLGSSTEDWP